MSNSYAKSKDTSLHAGVEFPPPLIFLIAYGLGYGLHRLFPIGGLPYAWQLIGGVTFALVGLLLVSTSVLRFVRARTTVLPFRPTTGLVTTGVYRYTRNPMYVSFAAFYLAATVRFNVFWALLFLPLTLWIVQRYVIRKEERYLESLFGEEYRTYQQQVRRWV